MKIQVFAIMINDNAYKEAKERCVNLVDKKFEEMHEFLACLLFCPDRKPISYENFAR